MDNGFSANASSGFPARLQSIRPDDRMYALLVEERKRQLQRSQLETWKPDTRIAVDTAI
jgi:hypothetical protein